MIILQFLSISNSITLSELSDIVGDRNVDYVLSANSLTRKPNIGSEFNKVCDQFIDTLDYIDDDPSSSVAESFRQRKITILNTFTQDSDVFEFAALSDVRGWKLLQTLGTFPGMLRIPDSVSLPNSVDVLGNNSSVSSTIYNKTMNCINTSDYPYNVDPAIFNEYSSIRPSELLNRSDSSNYANANSDPFQWFRLPWGEITLYSSLSGDSIDFPVYPESIDDGISATYTTMPDMLYQYEPWQVYDSSGPRSNTYTFDMHRDMWTGDHTDGKCNELIRFCEANCYPEYTGSLVNTALVILYIKGKPLIRGIMTDVSVSWDGPIGQDGFYLHCTLKLTIVEVSEDALSYSTVKNKPLIG